MYLSGHVTCHIQYGHLRVRSIFKLRISKVAFEILNTVKCLILDHRIGAKIDLFSQYFTL